MDAGYDIKGNLYEIHYKYQFSIIPINKRRQKNLSVIMTLKVLLFVVEAIDGILGLLPKSCINLDILMF